MTAEPISDRDVIDCMRRYGGSFVSHLAAAWRHADLENAARLRAAFPEIWERYTDLVQQSRANQAWLDELNRNA